MEEVKKRGKGRPVGSKQKFPGHSKFRDEFLKHNFDIIGEWVALYRQGHSDVQSKMIIDALTYIYPKRRPEDASGDSEAPLAVFVPTDEQLTMLCELAKKK